MYQLELAAQKRGQYLRAFARECRQSYPAIDLIEQRCGYAINRELLESMALPLQCPLKARAPNWQHGRVLYALLSQYLLMDRGATCVLDIGTAKGFSALCMAAALRDRHAMGEVVSVDVVDPAAAVERNSIADLDGLRNVHALTAPWPQSLRVEFVCSSGVDWLAGHDRRVNFCFVDGKHQYDTVRCEAQLLASHQMPGDIVVFDDLQHPGVAQAVDEAKRWYVLEYIECLPWRAYAVATRR